MRIKITLATLGLSWLLTAGVPPPAAHACGGCFSPMDTITNVDGHRMVISLSTDRTTLWDQIRYTGNPADFVWVLPVPSAAATIELADESFFTALDSQTAPVVSAPSPPPQQFCGESGGFGCGDSGDDAASGPDDTPTDGVTVYDEGVIGPYETVTIGSETAGALQDWLLTHGYNVPDATLPTIQYYADQASVFVVLRLAPGQGVHAMQPVRVRYPGYMASFPLKMVSVGATGALDLALWVIAEQRFEAGNYPTVQVGLGSLVWDWATNKSNYNEAFEETIQNAGGRAWVVEYASPLSYLYFDYAAQDEVTTASVGLSYPYVTRLRTHVLVEYLDEDLALRPAAQAEAVPNQLTAWREVNRPPAPDCGSGDSGDGCTLGIGHRARAVGTPFAIGLIGLLFIRRRGRRRR